MTAMMTAMKTIRRGCLVLGMLAAALSGCERAAPALADRGQANATPRAATDSRGVKFLREFDEGLERALSAEKPILVFFTLKQCQYCRRMKREGFAHPRVKALALRFVCIEVDLDEESDLCAEFGVTTYPTVQFLSPHGAPLKQISGKKTGAQLVKEMEAALKAVPRLATRRLRISR